MGTNRVLVQDADSISQRAAYVRDQTDPDYDWREDYAGQFRTAILYSKNLVLTDSQVFDGPLMLELGPRGLAEMLGTVHRTTEVIIALRDANPATSLTRMLKRTRIRKRSRFASQLDGLGWSASEIASRRLAWVRAIEAGKFSVTVWPTQAEFNFSLEMQKRLAESQPAVSTPLVQTLLTVNNRSNALHAIRASGISTDAESVMTGWWESAYMDTIARQHGGTWMSSARETAQSDDTAPSGLELRTSRAIAGVVTERGGQMSGPAFAVLRSDTLAVLRDYETRPSRRNRFRLGVAVLEATRSSKPIWDLVFTTARVASWGAVAFFAIVPLENAVPAYALPLAVVGALLQLPVTDVSAVGRFVLRSERAFIRTPL